MLQITKKYFNQTEKVQNYCFESKREYLEYLTGLKNELNGSAPVIYCLGYDGYISFKHIARTMPAIMPGGKFGAYNLYEHRQGLYDPTLKTYKVPPTEFVNMFKNNMDLVSKEKPTYVNYCMTHPGYRKHKLRPQVLRWIKNFNADRGYPSH